MAQISIIQKSDIAEARRFDAEYFKPEYLEIEKKLKKINSKYFSDYLLKITGGATPLGAEYHKKGIPFLRVQNIMQNYFNDDLVYISEKQDNEIKRSRLKENDVLLTITGVSYGKSAIVEKRYNQANINQHSVLMRFKKDLNPYFISTFLNCYYGKKQSDKNIVGLSRPALDYNRIKKYFLIPLFNNSFQLQIEKIVKEAHQKQTKSKQLYKEAEQLLLEELDLVDFQPKHKLTFQTTKKEVSEVKRFDAEYFQPKYFDIIKKIENYAGGFDTIKNMIDWKKGIEVGTDAYTKIGKDFVRVSDISINGVEMSNRKISTTLFTEIKDTFQPEKGEILFTKDGTIGISYLLKDNVDGVISSAFLRLTLQGNYQSFEKECLVLMLNSIICKLQIEQLSGGAIIAHLKPSDFEKFKIPLIEYSIQTKIADKITHSHQLYKESKGLLERAKTKVEQEIERT